MKNIFVVLVITLFILSACVVQQQPCDNQSVEKTDKGRIEPSKTSGAATAKTTDKTSEKTTAAAKKANATSTGKAPPVKGKVTSVKKEINVTKETKTPAQKPVNETQKVEEPKTSTEVYVLGKEGFDRANLAISSGSTIVWVNKDKIDVTLTIFKDGLFYKNSNLIKPGQSFSVTFGEKGNYEYWTVAYGVKATLAVN